MYGEWHSQGSSIKSTSQHKINFIASLKCIILQYFLPHDSVTYGGSSHKAIGDPLHALLEISRIIFPSLGYTISTWGIPNCKS